MTERRFVVENQVEDHECITARIRNYHEPITVVLFAKAIPAMECYHHDLAHDTLMLSDSKPGDKYLWSYRVTGTNLTLLNPHEVLESRLIDTLWGMNDHKSFHIIEVVQKRGMYADGFVTWITPTDLDDLKRICATQI